MSQLTVPSFEHLTISTRYIFFLFSTVVFSPRSRSSFRPLRTSSPDLIPTSTPGRFPDLFPTRFMIPPRPVPPGNRGLPSRTINQMAPRLAVSFPACCKKTRTFSHTIAREKTQKVFGLRRAKRSPSRTDRYLRYRAYPCKNVILRKKTSKFEVWTRQKKHAAPAFTSWPPIVCGGCCDAMYHDMLVGHTPLPCSHVHGTPASAAAVSSRGIPY